MSRMTILGFGIALCGFVSSACGQQFFNADSAVGQEVVNGNYAIGQFGGYGDFGGVGQKQFVETPYELPTIKFTIDGMLFFRVGGDTEQPLILEDEYPAPASLTSGDLGFDARVGGRAEMFFFTKHSRFAPRASVIWTGTELSKGRRTGDPADVLFFNAVDAEPAPGYTARNRSRFMLADVGVRKTVSPVFGWSAGVAFGELIESLDLVSDPVASTQQAGGTIPVEKGFYSHAHNQFLGFQLGMDGQLWTNGYLKVDGGFTAGVFQNEMTIAARAENAAQEWEPKETAFIGTWNLSFVIPADPVNFRIGYQGAYLTGMALPAAQSRERSIFQGTGRNVTEYVWYHGFLLGIELVR